MAAHAGQYDDFAVISSTLGVQDGRVCVGEASRGDIGCPTYAPYVASDGSISATRFVGDGSGLFNIAGASADRIVSGTTSMLAISNTGYISVTQSGVNTAYFHPSMGLVTVGVSSTGGISGTTGYFSGKVGIFTAQPDANFVMTIGDASNAYSNLSLRRNAGGEPSILFSSGSNTGASATQLRGLQNGGLRVTDGSGTAEYMRIVSSGVGIGTAYPSVTLHVATTVGAVAMFGTGGASTSQFISVNNRAMFGFDATSGNATLQSSASRGISLNVNGGFGSGTAVTIASNSLVGIGATSPSTALEVSGTVSATVLQVANTAPDSACAGASDLGKMRRNPTTGRMQVCR